MRRATITLLLSVFIQVMTAQTAYNYRYWWDNAVVVQTRIAESGAFEFMLNAADFTTGLHFLHLQVQEEGGVWAPPVTSSFVKLRESSDLDKAYYWFDQQTSDVVTAPTSGLFEIDPSSLSSGLHTLHYQAVNKAGEKSPVTTSIFVKLSESRDLDKAYYWFDQQTSDVVTAPTSGLFEIDPSSLSSGLHTLHYQAVNKAGEKSPVTTSIFVKLSESGTLNKAYYWFDNVDSEKNTVVAGEGFEVNISALKPGLHTLHYQVENQAGNLSTVSTDFFYVQRSAEGVRVLYWLDDDQSVVRNLPMGKSEIELDVSEMSYGDHSFNILLQDAANLPLGLYTFGFQVYDLSRMGDVNEDDVVDVADIVQTVNYIIGNNPTNFLRLRADINQDGAITVEDIVGIIRLIAGLSETGSAVKAFHVENNDVLSGWIKDRTLGIDLAGRQAYSAFQLSLTLPEGTDVEEVALALNRRCGHRIAYGTTDGKVMIVSYAVDNSVYLGQSGTLVNVLTSTLPEGDIMVDDIIFVTPDGGSRRFAPLRIESPTGIVATKPVIDETIIYDLAGRRLGKKPSKSGFYIQNGKKKVTVQ